MVEFFRKVNILLLKRFSRLRGKCMIYATKTFKIMVSCNKGLHMSPQEIVKCMEYVCASESEDA